MENETIIVSCFDINGTYSEEIVIDQTKNFMCLESPLRIISEYINENTVQNLSKTESEDKYITKYTFTQQFKGNFYITVNCDVINNFTVSHESTFDSNGYIIFCDLEKNTSLKLLEKIINYIVDNCSIFIRTYIVGVFKDHIDNDKDYNKMKEFLQSLEFDLEFEYYELFLGEKKNFFEMKNKYQFCRTLDDVFKDIFLKIYKDIATNDGKVIIEKGFGADRSGLLCKIF
jgi:hypothetical protein